MKDHLGAAHAELEALAAHGLDEHRQVQLAAAAHLEGVGAVRVLHPQSHVVLQLLLEALPDAAALDVLAVLASEGARVHHEHHGDGGLIDVHVFQGHGARAVRDGLAHADVLDARDGHDLAGATFLELDAAETLEAVELGDLLLLDAAVTLDQGHAVAHVDPAIHDAADADLADEVAPVHEGDQHLEGGVRAAGGVGAVLDDGVEEGVQVLAGVVHVQHGVAHLGAGKHAGEVQLLFRGAQLDEQVEDLVLAPDGAGAGAVHLVDDHDGPEPQGQGLAGHELGLRHGAVEGVHDQ